MLNEMERLKWLIKRYVLCQRPYNGNDIAYDKGPDDDLHEWMNYLQKYKKREKTKWIKTKQNKKWNKIHIIAYLFTQSAIFLYYVDNLNCSAYKALAPGLP